MKMKVTLGGDCGPGAAAQGRVRNLRPARRAGGCRGSVARRTESRRQISPAPRASRLTRVGFALLLAALALVVLPSAAVANHQRLTVPEGGSNTIAIEIRSRHNSPRNWTASCNNTNFSISPTSGSITVRDIWTPITFTVTSAEDTDLVDDTARCTVSSTQTFFDGHYADVTQTDNDNPTPVVTETDVRLREGGNTTVKVRLNLDPGGPVTVNVTKRAGGPVYASPTILYFTRNNWNSGRTVWLNHPSEQDGEQT